MAIYWNIWSLKPMIRGPSYGSYVWEGTEKQTNKLVIMNFSGFFALSVYYLSKGLKVCLESFWS